MAETLIDGTWLASGSAGTREVRSPYDGSVAGVVPDCGPAEVDRAMAAAVAALARDDFPRPDRIRVLEEASRALAGRVEEFARTIAVEAAKPI